MENKKIKITICMGSSCFSRGNNKTLEIIQNYIQENNLGTDVELSGCLCQNQCQKGPILQVNDKIYEEVDPGSALDILRHTLKETKR